MSDTVDRLLRDYESGRIGRRRFLQAVSALAAVGTAEARTAEAQSAVLNVRSLHHVELRALDFTQTGEFYAKLLGVTARYRQDRAVVPLPGDAHLSIGSAPTQPSIDHFALSVADYDPQNSAPVVDRLTAEGITVRERPGSMFFTDPDGRQVQIVPPSFLP